MEPNRGLRTVLEEQLYDEALLEPGSEYDFLNWIFSCPLPIEDEIDILLIEVHSNTVSGGVVTSTGQISGLGIENEE